MATLAKKSSFYHVLTYNLAREMNECLASMDMAAPASRNKITAYDRNFITEQGQDDNRFLRYKEKAKKKILEFLRTYDGIFEEDGWEEYMPFRVDTLEDLVACLCWAKITGIWDYTDFLHDYAIVDDDTLTEKDKSEMELFLQSIREKKDPSLRRIIDTEFSLALKKHISRCILRGPSIEEGNYVRRAMPDTDMECLQVVDDTVNWVFIDIQRLFRSYFLEGILRKGMEFLENGVADVYSTQSDAMDQRVAELEAENDALKKELARLKAEADQSCPEETEKLLDLMSEEQNDLARANRKLKSRYNGLYEKYRKLRIETETENREGAKEEQPILEVDRNARYVFLAHENAAFQANLLKEFPNARFIADTSDISPEGTDVVICISRHITHPVYYGVKAQCKTKKIPFLHTPSTNVDLITEVISNYQNSL